MARKLLEPIPPGEILYEEFMKPMGISINALARDIDVPPNRVSEVVNGKRAITADTAVVRKNPFMVRQAHHERDGKMEIQVCSRSS